MTHVAAQSLDAPPRPTPVTAPPLARLEPDLDRQLADACRLVAAASTIATTVTLVADLTSGDEDTAWLACDRRVAELVHEYGVEVWLAQEELQVRIRIEQFEPSLPPLPAPATEDGGAADMPVAPPRRRAAPLRWWRDRGGRR